VDRYLDRAKRFAGALDRCEFVEAAQWVADDCRYHSPDGSLTGVDAIIDSWRSNDTEAQRAHDRIDDESEVAIAGEREVTVTCTDHIVRRDETHRYRCRRILTLNRNGLITLIRHEGLPEEREALDAFLARRGAQPATDRSLRRTHRPINADSSL